MKKNTNQIKILKIRAVNKDIFDVIKNGEKKVETRAAIEKYREIKTGYTIRFICGREKIDRKVKRSQIFKTIAALNKKYKPNQINPKIKSLEELKEMYFSFPNYKEKIARYGLIAWELK